MQLNFHKKLETLHVGCEQPRAYYIPFSADTRGADLARELSDRFGVQIIASGGVSSIEDVKKLSAIDLYGAIVGKAYYTGAINLKEAIEVACQ